MFDTGAVQRAAGSHGLPARWVAPGRLPPQRPQRRPCTMPTLCNPQTNDDAITVISQPIILNITERHKNKNGCKMPAT